jgi:hypothetical protein
MALSESKLAAFRELAGVADAILKYLPGTPAAQPAYQVYAILAGQPSNHFAAPSELARYYSVLRGALTSLADPSSTLPAGLGANREHIANFNRDLEKAYEAALKAP